MAPHNCSNAITIRYDHIMGKYNVMITLWEKYILDVIILVSKR